jgi:hypothetical protein
MTSLKEIGTELVESRFDARVAAVTVRHHGKFCVLPCGPVGDLSPGRAEKQLREIGKLLPSEQQALRESSVYTVQYARSGLESLGVRFAKK